MSQNRIRCNEDQCRYFQELRFTDDCGCYVDIEPTCTNPHVAEGQPVFNRNDAEVAPCPLFLERL